MKLHRIKGVELKTCSAEQMISYNFCQTYKDMPVAWIADTADRHMKLLLDRFKRYDQALIVDLIRRCMGKSYHGEIATSYEQIGKAFPIR